MAFTDNCDVFASIHEKAFNKVVLELQRQRPSLFNYGTSTFAEHPEYLCNQKIISNIDSDVETFGNPVVYELPVMNIPGYTGSFGLEYCLQLAELSIDFHPGNIHVLPPELNPPLQKQRFSLKGRMCGGLACPGEVIKQLSPGTKDNYQKPDTKYGKDVPGQLQPGFSYATYNERTQYTTYQPPTRPEKEKGESQPIPFDPKNILCFCLDLYAVFHLEREGASTDPIIALKLDNLELVDIKPDGLENSFECFLKTMLVLGLLPKVKIAMKNLVFNIADVLTIGPTPISGAVPFNPAVEEDQVKVFISLTV